MSKIQNIILLFFILTTCFLTSTTHAQEVGLVAYYPFNGNANDESGNGNDGTVNGATLTTDRFGNESSAYSFDGVDDYIVTSANSILNSYDQGSFSFWFNLTEMNQSQTFLNYNESNASYGALVYVMDSIIQFHYSVPGFQTTAQFHGSTVIKTNKWYHVTIANNGSEQTNIYLNSELETTTFDNTGTTADGTEWMADLNMSTAGVISIGAFFHNNNSELRTTGLVDDIRIYNRALTESEIDSLYHEGGWETNPTISGDITYPDNQVNFPNGDIFIDVWENPTQWPFPLESPVIGFPIGPPVDFNTPVSYVIDDPILQAGPQYYVMVTFDEDNSQQPPDPEAEGFWGNDLATGAIDLSAGSVSGINFALQPISGGGVVDYESQIQPIFSSNCALSNCHVSGHITGLDLTPENSYGLLVNVVSTNYPPNERVIPFDANGSVLYNKVAATGTYGGQMPQPPNPALAPGDIQLIMDWINEGATAGGGGQVEGDLTFDPSVSGNVIVGLFFPGDDPNYWDQRALDRYLGYYSSSIPNQFFEFSDPGIVDADGYHIVSFVDENGDNFPNPEEAYGRSEPFTVSGGYYHIGSLYVGLLATGGYSFDFGATGGYAETNFTVLDGGPQITMELFFKLHRSYGSGEYYELIGRNNWAYLEYDGDTGEFYFGLEGIGDIEWQHSPNPGEWHHLAADYDGVNMTIYWDGDMKASVATGGGNLPTAPPDMQIGDGFDGLADVIRISEVALYYPNNFDPWSQGYNPNTNTHLLYNCNEGGGNQLIDDSGHEHHATITGTPTWDPDEPLGPVAEGRIAGNVTLNEEWAPAQVRMGLWFPENNPDVDPPDLSKQWGQDPPFSISYEFIDVGIQQGGPYTVRAFFDANGNGSLDGDEPQGEKGNLNVPAGNELLGVNIVMSSQVGGHVEGNIHSAESASGNLIIGLFEPGNSSEWNPNFELVNPGTSFPSDFLYAFDDAGIYNAFGWEVRAFLDKDDDYWPETDEMQGASSTFQISGGSAYGIDFDLFPPGAGPQIGISTTQLNFIENVDTLEFQVGNLGQDVLYWEIYVEYESEGDTGWISIDPVEGASTTPNEDNITVTVTPTGSQDSAEIYIDGYSDSGYDNWIGDRVIEVHLDAWSVSAPQIGISTTQLNFTENVDTLEFQVGNVGQDVLYWEIYVEYDSSGTLDWIISIGPSEGSSTSPNEDNITVIITPTGFEEAAEIYVDGFSDPDYNNWIGDRVIEVHLEPWIAAAPPEITGNLGGITANENEDIIVQVQIVAKAGLKRAELKYVIGGDQTSKTSQFTNTSGDNYQATILFSDVTKRGLIGFIEAEDDLDRVTVSDTSEIRVGFNSISILGTSPERYVMISVPGDLNNKNAQPILFEEYDNTQVRLFRWKNNGYQEYPSIDKLDPGKAFWIITLDATTLMGGSGTSTRLIPSHTINLDQGWNQIGTPYNFGNGINDLIYTPGSIEPTFYEYDGSGYRTVNMMNPGKGYWLYAHEATSIKVNPRGLGLAKLMTEGVPLPLNWGGRVKASTGNVHDYENVFGVISSATETWDEFDRHEPPVIGDYITLAFDNRNWESRGGLYAQDIQPEGMEGYLWQFVVKTNQEGSVNLDVEKIKALPPDWDLFVLDKDLGIVHKVQEMNQYRFVSTDSEIERNFSLLVGPDSFTKEIIKEYNFVPTDYTLLQNVPNPFNAITTIRFGLPEDGKVSLTIYSILGQKVAVVISEQEFTAGSHAILWDGKNDAGRGVATGVYLYYLTVRKDGGTKFHQARKLVLLK